MDDDRVIDTLVFFLQRLAIDMGDTARVIRDIEHRRPNIETVEIQVWAVWSAAVHYNQKQSHR